jgi:putative spermidine/putrescine transport system substrate-binding protein
MTRSQESNMSLSRRQFAISALSLGALNLFPGISLAQARKLVVATFQGGWEVAHRDVLVPYFRKTNGNADIALDSLLSVDQIAKINAARSNPPMDVMLMDPGPALTAIAQGLAEPYPIAKSQYYKSLLPAAQEPMGPAVFFQAVGLSYNPEKIKTPPTSWADLWKPEYKGRVGVTNMNSTLGTGFMVEIAKMRGGSESNLDPAFKAMAELRPNIGAVASNPGALAALFSQGEIDIAPGNFNHLQPLIARGVAVQFAKPKEGTIGFKTTMHIVKNSPNAELAFKLIEAALSPEVQGRLMEPPYIIVPTNAQLKMSGAIATSIAKDQAEMQRTFVFHDWNKINEQRAAWIERYNREIKA